MFESLPRNHSRKDLALVALLVVALTAFAAQLVSGPSTRTAAPEQRAASEASLPARG
jgi:hypothetical protein